MDRRNPVLPGSGSLRLGGQLQHCVVTTVLGSETDPVTVLMDRLPAASSHVCPRVAAAGAGCDGMDAETAGAGHVLVAAGQGAAQPAGLAGAASAFTAPRSPWPSWRRGCASSRSTSRPPPPTMVTASCRSASCRPMATAAARRPGRVAVQPRRAHREHPHPPDHRRGHSAPASRPLRRRFTASPPV